MAGDWIKMECATPDKPEVLAITARMGWDDPDLTVGKLFRVWRWFDQQTTDGNASGVTSALLDRIAIANGFAAAMVGVGWLVINDSGAALPSFSRHCGKTAKERANGAKRAASFRSNAGSNADTVTDCVADALPREDKREELTTSSLRSDVVSALPADDEPQRKTSGTPKRAMQLPDDFEPDDTAAALAAELGVSLAAELPKFRDYHAARGKPMKDWQAALRTWLRNAKQFAKPTAKQTESDRRAAWLADITGRNGNAIDAPARIVG